MKQYFVLLSFLASFVCAAIAEPTDLGSGLTYLRIHSLTKSARDLNAALLRPMPLVLDLRYTADEPGAGNILRVLNSAPAKPRLYVLVSPATPAAVADIIASSSARFITLGVKASRPMPQVVVEQAAAADHSAYDALDAGTPVDALISGKIEKERFDEATLVQEFKNGNHDAEPPPGPDPTAPALSKVEGPKPDLAARESPLVDRVLQRAVHLHRAIMALKSRP